jgi:hypothetical protein
LIQVWINQDSAENAVAWMVKLDTLVRERSGGRDLANEKILDLLRGIVIFTDEARKAEAMALCKKNQIQHCAVAYVLAKTRNESLGGYGIPSKVKNVVFVSYEETITAVYKDLSPNAFDKIVKAYEDLTKRKQTTAVEEAPQP